MLKSERTSGVRGSRSIEEDIKTAAGRIFLLAWVRQGRIPVRLLGAMVRVMA